MVRINPQRAFIAALLTNDEVHRGDVNITESYIGPELFWKPGERNILTHGTAAELMAGTEVDPRIWSPLTLAAEIKRRVDEGGTTAPDTPVKLGFTVDDPWPWPNQQVTMTLTPLDGYPWASVSDRGNGYWYTWNRLYPDVWRSAGGTTIEDRGQFGPGFLTLQFVSSASARTLVYTAQLVGTVGNARADDGFPRRFISYSDPVVVRWEGNGGIRADDYYPLPNQSITLTLVPYNHGKQQYWLLSSDFGDAAGVRREMTASGLTITIPGQPSGTERSYGATIYDAATGGTRRGSARAAYPGDLTRIRWGPSLTLSVPPGTSTTLRGPVTLTVVPKGAPAGARYMIGRSTSRFGDYQYGGPQTGLTFTLSERSSRGRSVYYRVIMLPATGPPLESNALADSRGSPLRFVWRT